MLPIKKPFSQLLPLTSNKREERVHQHLIHKAFFFLAVNTSLIQAPDDPQLLLIGANGDL